MSDLRNIAVIAHVDHGKTTLVDALLKQSHVFRDNQDEMKKELIMDTNDLERERGITILAKNCSIHYQNTKINIIDTPGHADFSGEVERTLSMADGAILIIDAQEGPMPQTRFVLKKSLELHQKIIVVINKIDKKLARVLEVERQIEDLFLELATTEDQLDFPVLYAIAREGIILEKLPENVQVLKGSIEPLLNVIISYIKPPLADDTKPFKMIVSSLDYDNHFGSIAIGKIAQGKLSVNNSLVFEESRFTATKVMVTEGLLWKEVDMVGAGEIVAIAGIKNPIIGETITDLSDVTPLPPPLISPPTLLMSIAPNSSPLSGKEGSYVTTQKLEERIVKELKSNVALKMERVISGQFQLAGKGELHLSIFLETIRREGFEVEVGKPEVILKDTPNGKEEPIEDLLITVPNEHIGVINKELGIRRASLISAKQTTENETEFMYLIPTRALLGLRAVLITATKGTVIMNSAIAGYEKLGTALPKLRNGALIAHQSGNALAYGLRTAQDRGITFVAPGTYVYEGMIVGLSSKDMDITVNVCKGKKLTNMRSKASDGVIQLAPPVEFSLEQALDMLESDELLEITPKSLRLRKKYLTEIERKRFNKSTIS